MMEEHVRIGVYLCSCGGEIRQIIDLDKVLRLVEKLPGIVHVAKEEYLCSEEALHRIKEDICRHSLNRVVFAACRPKTDIDTLLCITLHEAGLNPSLAEWVNIRERCAWVHYQEPEKATGKAYSLIRMAIAKVRLAQPMGIPTPQVDNDKCIRCGICELICPFDAVKVHAPGAYITEINEHLCRMCGICVAACPAMAIELPNLTRRQIIVQIGEAFSKIKEV